MHQKGRAKNYIERKVSGPLTLSAEWQEITPREPLHPERMFQRIILDLKESVVPDYKVWGLRLKDGAVVVAEVELVSDGKTYTLKCRALSAESMHFALNELPKDRVYSKVRIRAARPIKCSRIAWRCYDPWDRK